MTHEDDVKRVVGMMQRIKRLAGPAQGIVKHRWTGSQAANYLKRLESIYLHAKAIQDDLMRGG